MPLLLSGKQKQQCQIKHVILGRESQRAMILVHDQFHALDAIAVVEFVFLARLRKTVLKVDLAIEIVLDLHAEEIAPLLLRDMDPSFLHRKRQDAFDGVVDGIAEDRIDLISRDIGKLASVQKAGKGNRVVLERGLLACQNDVDRLVSGMDRRIIDVESLHGLLDFLLAHLSLQGGELMLEVVALDVDEVDVRPFRLEFLFLLQNHAVELGLLLRYRLGMIHAKKDEKGQKGDHRRGHVEEDEHLISYRRHIFRCALYQRDEAFQDICPIEIVQPDDNDGQNDLARLVFGKITFRRIHLSNEKPVDRKADAAKEQKGQKVTEDRPFKTVGKKLEDAVIDQPSPDMLYAISRDAAIDGAQKVQPEAYQDDEDAIDEIEEESDRHVDVARDESVPFEDEEKERGQVTQEGQGQKAGDKPNRQMGTALGAEGENHDGKENGETVVSLVQKGFHKFHGLFPLFFDACPGHEVRQDLYELLSFCPSDMKDGAIRHGEILAQKRDTIIQVDEERRIAAGKAIGPKFLFHRRQGISADAKDFFGQVVNDRMSSAFDKTDFRKSDTADAVLHGDVERHRVLLPFDSRTDVVQSELQVLIGDRLDEIILRLHLVPLYGKLGKTCAKEENGLIIKMTKFLRNGQAILPF